MGPDQSIALVPSETDQNRPNLPSNNSTTTVQILVTSFGKKSEILAEAQTS